MFTGQPSEALIHDKLPLGVAAKLLADAGRGHLSIASMIAWLATPIRLGQALFMLSWERVPLGFATWAYVTPETLRLFASGERDLPLLEDWNEGGELWIVDVVAPYGHVDELVRHLRARLQTRHEVVHFRRGDRYQCLRPSPVAKAPKSPDERELSANSFMMSSAT